MARGNYTRVGAGPRILLLLLIVLLLGFAGSIWFDYLGIFDVKDTLAPVFKVLGLQPRTPVEAIEGINLLESARIQKEKEAIELRSQELDKREGQIEEQNAEIQRMLEELEEKRIALEDQEKSFNDQVRLYDNKRANLEQNAEYLTGMPPDQAVKILLEMENDQDVIDHLRVTEELAQAAGEDSIVSYWLSLMPSDRAAELQRKMTLKSN